MPLGPSPQYLCKYNAYTLPGYVQNESMDSIMNIASHYGAYIDGSPSEDMGLGNKQLSVQLKVWEQDYLTCKQQVELAATMVRSSKVFAPLYLQFSDRHYMALAKSIKMQKEAGRSVRTLDYDVEFECKPWLYGETLHTLTGTGTVTTDQVGRTISDGAWTPTTITVSGTNITITGSTDNGEPTGSISIAGAVTNLVIDTEAFTAKIGATNRNDVMTTADYRMYVGAGKTTFIITGASSCSIAYYDRWYI